MRKLQPRLNGRLRAERAFDLKIASRFGDFDSICGDHKCLARRYKRAVVHASGFLQHDQAVGKIQVLPNQPGRSLNRRFQHHDPGENRKVGKVIGQVFFRHRDVFRHHQVLARLVGQQLIDQNKLQAVEPSTVMSQAQEFRAAENRPLYPPRQDLTSEPS